MCSNRDKKDSEEVDKRHHSAIENASDEEGDDESSAITRPTEFFDDFSTSIGDFFELFKE